MAPLTPPIASPARVRSAQSNESRISRLECLKARDDAMQNVLAEAASKLPSLVSGSAYPALLEALILEVRAYNARAALR